ncbi:hypothetical protein LXL04_033783 [Taraxacum kok-saghyz]
MNDPTGQKEGLDVVRTLSENEGKWTVGSPGKCKTLQYIGSAWDELKHTREASKLLAEYRYNNWLPSDFEYKYWLVFEHEYNGLPSDDDKFRTLSKEQLKRIRAHFWDMQMETAVKFENSALSSTRAYLVSGEENLEDIRILLDDSMPFSIDDMFASIQVKDFAKIEPAAELAKTAGDPLHLPQLAVAEQYHRQPSSLPFAVIPATGKGLQPAVTSSRQLHSGDLPSDSKLRHTSSESRRTAATHCHRQPCWFELPPHRQPLFLPVVDFSGHPSSSRNDFGIRRWKGLVPQNPKIFFSEFFDHRKASKSPVKVTVARRKNQFAGENDTVAPETRRRRRPYSNTVATL